MLPKKLSNIISRINFKFHKNYLNNYKVEKSKELLANTDYSLLDIALSVGFNNQSYYSTVFKKLTNQTPIKYRESLKE